MNFYVMLSKMRELHVNNPIPVGPTVTNYVKGKKGYVFLAIGINSYPRNQSCNNNIKSTIFYSIMYTMLDSCIETIATF